MNQQDWLRLCNEHNTPIEDFGAMFCIRCFQPECSRSQHGKSRFEVRASTWEQRLFTAVPKLDPSDPRFATISAQKFISIDMGKVPEIRSDWNDPRELTEAASVSAPEPTLAPIPEVRKATPRPVVMPGGETSNAPNQSGRMLGGQPAQVPQDSWRTPNPVASDPTVRIVSPGSTVKLGGSG